MHKFSTKFSFPTFFHFFFSFSFSLHSFLFVYFFFFFLFIQLVSLFEKGGQLGWRLNNYRLTIQCSWVDGWNNEVDGDKLNGMTVEMTGWTVTRLMGWRLEKQRSSGIQSSDKLPRSIYGAWHVSFFGWFLSQIEVSLRLSCTFPIKTTPFSSHFSTFRSFSFFLFISHFFFPTLFFFFFGLFVHSTCFFFLFFSFLFPFISHFSLPSHHFSLSPSHLFSSLAATPSHTLTLAINLLSLPLCRCHNPEPTICSLPSCQHHNP